MTGDVEVFKAKDGTDAFCVLHYRDGVKFCPPPGWFVELAQLIEDGVIHKSSASKVIDGWYEWFYDKTK